MISLRRARRIVAPLAALAIASCTSGQVGQYSVTHVDPATNSKLQFGVGWATEATLGSSYYGVNLVETFRQSDGRSAVLSDTAEIDVPPAVANALNLLTPGTTTLRAPALPEALGAGFNDGSFTLTGSFAANSGTGGPPAFPPPADSTSATKQFSEGYLATFPVTSTSSSSPGLPLATAVRTYPGPYVLNVTIPTGQASTEVVHASATLGRAPLAVYAPPAIAVDGSGGALVTITVPAGVTETLVTVTGTACQPQAASGGTPASVLTVSEAYTLVSHVAGPGTDRLTLPDFVTPVGGLGTYQSLCSAAELAGLSGGFNVYAVGVDYPAFESVYPQSFSEAPAIVGAAGQPDITISLPTSFVTP
jgi:hypothetical protein